MAKFVDGKEIAFREHVLDIKYVTIIIDDFKGIMQCKLPLFDEAFGCVYADRNALSMVAGLLSKTFDVLEIANCICKKLTLSWGNEG